MPKSRSKPGPGLTNKVYIKCTEDAQGTSPSYSAHSHSKDSELQNQTAHKELNNFDAIAFAFPLVIQKILLYLEPPEHKSLRLCNKGLRNAINHYIGLSLVLTESRTEFEYSEKVQMISKDLLASLKTFGIRSLVGIKLTKTTFVELITFPYLLQNIQLIGKIDQNFFLGILKDCWNVKTLKLQEPSPYQKLIQGSFTQFIHSINQITGYRGNIRLENLKNLQIYCSTTSTMAFMLVLLSMLEAPRLEEFQCFIGPVHGNFYSLISGLVIHIINGSHQHIKSLSLMLESGDAYPEMTAKSRLFKKLTILDEHPNLLPKFKATFDKLYLNQTAQDVWLKEELTKVGAKIRLNALRLDIDTSEDFSQNWFHLVKQQKCLRILEIQTCCVWTLMENVVKDNSKSLEKLSLCMEYTSVMDMENLLQNCSNLKYLTLKNYNDLDTSQLELRRQGHIINAKFDQLFPNLEGLTLTDLLIRCADVSHVTGLTKLKSFMLSLVDMNINEQLNNPSQMFGILYQDMKKLLQMRKLDHLVLSKESLVCSGPIDDRLQDAAELTVMLQEPMFYNTNVFDCWFPYVKIDEEHIAVAHGEKISMADWFCPFLMSVIEDSIVTDLLWTRSLITAIND